MPIDKRTPVIVGVGQVTSRPDPADAATQTDPLSLMVGALELAAEDATGTPGTHSSLLGRIDELTAIPSFVWHVADPARCVAEAMGITPRATLAASVGGTLPQRVVLDASTRILAGELDVAVVVGAEAIKSRDVARKRGEHSELPEQDPSVPPAREVFAVPDALTDHERSLGLALPVHSYALFEHARRRARGLTREAHLGSLGALAARMSAVASRNEHAWLRTPVSALEVITPSPANRLVSTPYTKLLTSNVVVDMGAAVIVCSLEAARGAGVPEDQFVFPQQGAWGYEQWLISRRRELSQSLAMRWCARALFGDAPPSPEEASLLELYSCFPIAVEMACDALGIDPLSDPRPPTVTGGMTFFGGPGNNFATHSIATMVGRLRREPGAIGLVTALGWYASTHVWATYSTTPRPGGLVVHDVRASVEAEPLRDADDGYAGPGDVESYTVGVDRDGAPARTVASVRTPSGARRLVASDDASLAAEVLAADPLGAEVTVSDGSITLA